MMTIDREAAPLWMRRVLLAAGAYNIVWGLAVVAAPSALFKLVGMVPPNYPWLFQCIGMIVGVYGIGYIIASRDPRRHWPIVLVGLLGKIFGPIGFVWTLARGDLPASFGLTILTNDLLWWIPFAMILWDAARTDQRPTGELEQHVSVDKALHALHDERGQKLRTFTEDAPVLVVLLRHAGCTFCREALADLGAKREKFLAQGVRLAIVGMSSTSEELRALGARYGLNDAAWFADPDRLLYRALELNRGTFLQLFGPRVWWRGMVATMRGLGVGRLEGDGFQMPGAFVIHKGKVLRAFRHATAADRPDYEELACPVGP